MPVFCGRAHTLAIKQKAGIILLCMKRLFDVLGLLVLIALVIILLFATSCSRWCDPSTIRSGESNRHHDTKKFRVMWIHRDGPVYHVRYMNMITTVNQTYYKHLPDSVQEGKWITIP